MIKCILGAYCADMHKVFIFTNKNEMNPFREDSREPKKETQQPSPREPQITPLREPHGSPFREPKNNPENSPQRTPKKPDPQIKSLETPENLVINNNLNLNL